MFECVDGASSAINLAGRGKRLTYAFTAGLQNIFYVLFLIRSLQMDIVTLEAELSFGLGQPSLRMALTNHHLLN